LVESLNMDAYKKAREKVSTLQQQPNIFNGKTLEDYRAPDEDEEENPDAFIFMPPSRK